MNKYLKYFLIVVGIIIGLWLVVVALFMLGVFKLNINIGPF